MVRKAHPSDWVFQGGSHGGLAYRGAFDSKTMINTLSGSIKGSVNFILFGGSVKFSISNKVTENESTAASTLVLNYTKGSYNLQNRRIKPQITSLLQSDPAAARSKCGDGYIHNVKLGSNLYVSAKLHFKSRSEYEWYQTKVKIKVLFWSKTVTKTKEFYEATQNAVYSIQVNSDGGMTPALSQLASGGTRYCKTDNMDACIDYAEQLYAYLLDGGDYANDLSDAQLNTMSYEVASYEKSGHYALAYAGTANITQRYIELSQRLRGYQGLVNNEIESLQAFIAVADEGSEKTQYQTRLADRQQQKIGLDDSAEYCFTLPGATLCEINMEASIALVD